MKFLKRKNRILVGLFIFFVIFYFSNLTQVFAQNPPPSLDIGLLTGSLFGPVGFLVGKALDGDPTFITDIAAKVFATAVFVISFIISIIGGLFINLEAWFVEVVLAMNDQILKSEFVQVGYQISLAVANLIFVAGLIVIAIATILKSKSYSVKQILWKLILMTVLVNFGLSIAGTLIQISTDFSWYFLDAVNPGGGPGESQYIRFASAIAGAFNPQSFFITNITEGGEAQTASNKNVAGPITQQDQKQIAGLFGGSLAKILTPIVSIFFTITFLTIIIITLGALVVMLIIRYIAISLLLILLPLAWALWIFPNIGSMASLNPFREWWNRFIRWTFFAPIVLFFLYLCLLTLRATPGGEGSLWGTEIKIQNVTFTFNRTGPLGGLEAFGGSFLINLLVPILNAVVMTGCVMGGLIVANKLSIMGAKKAEDVAYGTAKSIGMFAWNRTRGLGAAGLNKLLPKTPPPPEKGRLGRALHTVGFKAGQLAERFGVREKIEETAEKYGPSTWSYLPKNWMQRREKAKEIKGEIEKINKEIQSVMPTLLAKRQEELNALQQNLQKIDSEFNNQIQKQEAIIDAVKSRLETEMDINKRDQIKKELEAEEQKLNELISQRKTRVDEIDNQIKQKEKELELSPEEQPEIKELIARRRQKYQELRDLKPEGIFGVIVRSTLEPLKGKKQKVKIPKKALEEAGIEIEGEKKEESKQNQQNQGQKKP